MLQAFFITDQDPSLILNGTYNPWLVFLSFAIAIFAAFFTSYLIDLAKKTSFSNYKLMSKITAASVFSTGIWSMHFIGMIAFSLCTQITYDPTTTFLSFIPAFLACQYAMFLLVDSDKSMKTLIQSSILLGAGIGTMHYSGMAAMELAPLLRYDPIIFILSIFVAIGLSFIGLYTRVHLEVKFPQLNFSLSRFISASILGFAVTGMHYMGMAASRFVATSPIIKDTSNASDLNFIAIAVATATIVLTSLVAVFNGIVRYKLLLSEKTAEQSRLNAILGTAIDGIITIDHKGVILSINEAVTKIFGWQSDEILGKNVKMLMDSSIAKDHDSYLKHAANIDFGKVIGINRDVHAKHKNGQLFPIRLGVGEVKLQDQTPLFVGFITDLTEQRALQQSLIEKEQSYRSLMNNMPGVAFRCEHNTARSTLFISPNIVELTGYTPDEFTNNNIEFINLILKADQLPLFDVINQALKDKRQYSVEYRIRHRNGSILWLLEQGSFDYNEQGETNWIDGVLIDITDRKEYEEKLESAKLAAEEAAIAKQSFMANMSHEIRTPMNAIIGFSDLLMDTPLNQEQQRHLITVNDAARSLLRLLNEILDSAKLERGKLTIEPLHFTLKPVIDSIISTFWLEAKKKNLNLTLKIDDSVHTAYYGDPDRLRQVLTNLIGNAIKFTEKGAVSVEVRTTQNEHLFFEVNDTGIGIAKDRIKAIFQPFEQADGTTTRRFGGTGLGTTISKQLVELMGGTINLVSEVGKGSCFYFSLPLEPGDENKIDHFDGLHTELPPLRILVVDDIAQNTELLSLLLSRDEHSITTASNGHEAIAIFKEQDFDVILMDIHMPECDGIEATYLIREIEQARQLKNTPIIALTASVLQQDKLTAKKAGMNGFANKPVDINQLNQEIAMVMGYGLNKEVMIENNDPQSLHIDFIKGTQLWGTKCKQITQISRYLKDNKENFDNLIAQNNVDMSDFKTLTHTLRGVAGNLGLTTLMKLLTDLEHSNTDTDIHPILLLLKEELDTVVKLMSANLCPKPSASNLSQSNDNDPTSTISIDELNVHIDQLLNDSQSAELNDDLLENLKRSAPAKFLAIINNIADAFDEFDFDSAHTLLLDLKKDVSQEKGEH
ncbi:PAS domain S-box protein [Pseudoalteromonas sp. MMG010]|uniref:MHYT domain-containing protein n=1 Tax=Pseudoalteromonas sp. MMG010 TaxID=2822685 RepID=UPI001B3A764F|nr:MHYT domain-containing protein [Pseudoalteromonas sp. MMG010]MBQ4833285.1 PAS domain S-box protein [Pseudoalteromonas sp. MMG010]